MEVPDGDPDGWGHLDEPEVSVDVNADQGSRKLSSVSSMMIDKLASVRQIGFRIYGIFSHFCRK